MIDDADGASRKHQQISQTTQVARHEGDVGGVDGDVVAQCPHGDAEIAFLQCGGIIEAIPDDEDAPALLLEGADAGDFVLREALGLEIGDADAVGDVLGDFSTIPGEHDEVGDAETAQAREGFRSFITDAVSE